MVSWEAELAVARQAAHAALELLATRPDRVDAKGAVDLVTDVDRRCEAVLRELLTAAMPDVPVLGEESGGSDAATRWVIDPVDGTTNFVHGFPWYACSIALEVDGRSVVGIVVEPVRRRWFEATRGGGAFVDGVRLAVSQTPTLGQALLATGFPYDRAERTDALLVPVARALQRSRGIRRAGAASLDLAYVAAGALDGFWEHDLSPWDVAAGTLLISEAGGRVTTHDGTSTDRAPTSPAASNGHVHEALLELLTP
jgi:myo-inositol-1(or 4)-monophosphatase